MLCVLPVCKHDVPRLLNLLKWICQLGGCREHDAAVVADAATPMQGVFQIRDEARKVFATVQIVTTERAVNGWPEGPNELFLTAARFANHRNIHWLFLEPDSVPLCPGWLDRLDIQYRATGARYLGQLVPCHKPSLPPKHFTGVGIYPANAIDDLEAHVVSKPYLAFDLSTAEVVAPIATHCDLFQHLWGEIDNPPTFAENGIPGTATFGLSYLRKNAVLFHRTKDGKLIQLLRQRLGINEALMTRAPFIQLGRYGDIILLLPALKYIADTTGARPKLICSTDYLSVLDGVSYVEPIALQLNWHDGLGAAQKYAHDHFGGGTVLQCYGVGWQLNFGASESYMVSMNSRTGVPLSMFYELPLVFDRRCPEREQQYIPQTNGRPYVLVNTAGISSPFGYGHELIAALQRFKDKFIVVDISAIRCERIYDLLGPMDHALGTVTIDTSTLHLAHGSCRPYVALTVDGWCSSTPRGKCDLEVKYSRFHDQLPRILQTVESWL